MSNRINNSLRLEVMSVGIMLVGLLSGFTETAYADLATIEITPTTANLHVGDQQQFTATGKDVSGNPVTLNNPIWEYSGGGIIFPNGNTCTYFAMDTGDYQIRCKQAGTTIQGTADIHTTDPDQLTTIEITPTSVNMQVGDQQQFTATGKDGNGNPMTITNPVWVTSGGGTITPNGTTCTYTSTQGGEFTISCKEGGTTIQGTANINATASGGLAKIEITPTSVNMQVGDQQQFTATGKDASDNPVTITNPVWEIPGGGTLTTNGTTCTYTATQNGDFTITCRQAGTTIQAIAKAHVGPDFDGDGIRDSAENGAPNNGDGNGDGVPDSRQANVTSLPSATGQGYITIETTGSENKDVWAYTEKQTCLGTKLDYNFNYVYGLVGLRLPCTSATVRIYFHGIDDLAGYIYRKYGPIPPDFDKPQWYTLPNVIYGTTMIGGQLVAYAEFVLVDGGLGDDTGVDGQIIEPGGPALIAGDFNMDLVVNFIDLQFLAEQWLAGSDSEADLDGSGQVDNVDFALFSQQWYDKP